MIVSFDSFSQIAMCVLTLNFEIEVQRNRCPDAGPGCRTGSFPSFVALEIAESTYTTNGCDNTCLQTGRISILKDRFKRGDFLSVRETRVQNYQIRNVLFEIRTTTVCITIENSNVVFDNTRRVL